VILAIDLGNEKIKIVVGSKSFNNDSIAINKCASLNIPPDSMEDGKIINIDLIKAAIEKVLLENNIKIKNTVFVINSNIVSTRKMELPLLKRRSDTMSMIKFEFEQLLDANLNHMVIFKTSEKIIIDSTNRVRYIVYGLPVNVYNQYVELSKKLKLTLTGLDISSNFLEKIPKENIKINDKIYNNGINAFININDNAITFSVLNKGINEFSRIIYLNSNEEKMYNIEKVAENSNSIYMNTNIISNENSMNKWLDEISKYIRYYYYSIDNENTIDKIYIYGVCSEIVGIEKFFFINLNIDTEIIYEISKFKLSNLPNEINIIDYFHVALALFINKKDINFLTDKIHNQKYKFNLGVTVMAIFIFFVLVLALYAQSSIIYYKLLKDKTETMSWYVNKEENISFNSKIEILKSNIERLKKYNELAINVKEIISEDDIVNSKIFREIANAKPHDTRITFIIVDNHYINMQCNSTDIKDTMLFIKNLRSINFIESTYIPSVDVKQESGHTLSYSIICKLRGWVDGSKQ